MRMSLPHCTVLAVAIMACACQSPSPATAGDGAMTDNAAATAVIHGRATYLQRIKIAPGASLHVQLIDSQLADTPMAVLAQVTLKDVAGPPYAFALPYEPSKLRAGGMYGLHANLAAADGHLLFVTDTRVPYTPGQDDVGEFVMTMVNGAR
jgi:uncharacterized lipoprotein YbaY